MDHKCLGGWRLIIKKNGEFHKFLRFWGIKSDTTLKMKVYSCSNGTMLEANSEQISEYKENGRTIRDLRISYDKLTATDFIPDHTSFHPSGYHHIKNKKDQRYKDGLIWQAFDDVDTNTLLALILAQNFERYPSIHCNKLLDDDVVINLDELPALPEGPFTAKIFLFRGDKKNTIPEKDINIIFGADVVCGPPAKINLLVRLNLEKTCANKPYPPYTFVMSMHKTKEKPLNE